MSMHESTHFGSSALDPTQLLQFTYYRGRVALKALLSALGISNGDLVITQAFTCLAVPEGIISVGALPKFVDIEEGGVNMDPDALKAAIDPTVKAIIVQHTFGIPAQLDRILPIAEEHGLPVVEDCCHSFGSLYKGRMLGQFGVGSFYSYEWGKQVVIGIGGSAVPTVNKIAQVLAAEYERYAEPPKSRIVKINLQYFAFEHLLTGRTYWFFKNLFKTLSRSGIVEGNFSGELAVITSGFDWRLDNGLKRRLERKLQDLPVTIERSRQVAEVYRTRLPFPIPTIPKGSDVAYPRYPFFTEDKINLVEFAKSNNIEMADWYKTPVHPLQGPALRSIGYEPGCCPRAEEAARTIVSLPVSNKVTPAEADRIVNILTSYNK